ncbi:unnamed protein product [Symbiodinium necroappetens]|uniref:Uncharacterized protein n=1 Tax=Symbiodinium necroappetens TaxID=1628268 RepID=A0A812ZCL6_9DINO|nr:unnamed protein product [Symbiodinium necroappetens]
MAAFEALEYFRARNAKDGITAVLKLRAAASWAQISLSRAVGPLFSETSTDGFAGTLQTVQDLLFECKAEGQQEQQVHLLDVLAHVHLIRDNSNRALKCYKEALSLAKEVSSSVSHLQGTFDMIRRLRSEPPAAEAFDAEAQVPSLPQLVQEALKGSGASVDRCRLALVDFLAQKTKTHSAARAALHEALQGLEGSGMGLLVLGKMDLTSAEAVTRLHQASRAFRVDGLPEAEATALQALATALLVQVRPDPMNALQAAEEAQALFKEVKDLRGEAIALQLIANCRMLLQDRDRCITAGYEAFRLFVQVGDDHGSKIAYKLLNSLGQSDQQIRASAVKKEVARFDEVRVSEEKPEVSEELRAIMAEQVVWEYAWVPSETQDPKYFGEKRPSGTRRILVASELRDPRLTQQLARCRAKSQKAKPFFANLINGRLLTASAMESAMQASLCTAAVYDVTRLNNLTHLEVMDVAIRLVKALQPIEDPNKVALDIVLSSTQSIASVQGIRMPFHSTLWGFCRSARIENPTHEFRVLDVDAKTFKQDMAFITRYLLGAQSTRPMEAIVRKGALHVARLVSARAELKAPMKMVRKV